MLYVCDSPGEFSNRGMKMKIKSGYPYVMAAAAAAMMAVTTPLFASEADEKIEESFKQSYVYKTYLKDDSVSTDAKDGVVTLTGTVSEKSHKTLAEDTVASLPGVTRVDNQLETKAEVAADRSDLWITRKVRLSLFFHRNTNESKTTVEVKDGVVTLTGEASSQAQKELTTEYANDIDGVKSVTNQMTVAKAPEVAGRTAGEIMDDASITAQVRSALLTHRSTSMTKTKVETREGKVTITGIAQNAAEKTLVTKLVNNVNGVKSVNNEMTVQAAPKS
jgi:hyperosmotically inducible periplasmic protein